MILPDSTILLDYLQHRAIALVRGHDGRRRAHAREPRAHPRRAVLPARAARARRGAARTRDDAYRIVQELAQRAWDEGTPLRELLAADERAAGLDLDAIFDYGHYTRHAREIVARLDGSDRLDPALVASRHVSALADLPLIASGKVREMYDLSGPTAMRLLMVASDRISTYDAVHPTPIPDKGKVLDRALGLLVRARPAHIVANHLISATDGVPEEARGRALVVRKLQMLPVECVVRGYITGSGWKDYQATGAVSGIELPAGLRESEQLPEPIFTPEHQGRRRPRRGDRLRARRRAGRRPRADGARARRRRSSCTPSPPSTPASAA